MDFKEIFSYGRKRAFETNEELQEKIIEYFTDWFDTKRVYDKKLEEVVDLPILTITGLSLFLGFADRRSFYDYEKRWEKENASSEEIDISHTLKRARTFIEKEYESQLQTWNNAWAIFALKNFGWKDTQTIEWELNNNWDSRMVVEYVSAAHENIDKNWDTLQIDEEVEE